MVAGEWWGVGVVVEVVAVVYVHHQMELDAPAKELF
jgi:hypothetical protein